jgi:hypothetical protein
MKENQEKKDATPKGWKPDAPSGEEALTDDERSLDIGESGQFAPGGYYNQHGVNKPKRTTGKWDDEITPPGRH